MPATKKTVRGPQRFVRLPNGKKMPLAYTLPSPKECKMQDPRHCLHAEGLRAAGFRDPRVMPGDLAEIRAVYDNFRVVFPAKIDTILSAKQFDVGQGEEGGRECILPKPNKIVEIKKITTPRKKRRDAGMSKARADIVFNRKPGTKEVGRRARFLLKRIDKN